MWWALFEEIALRAEDMKRRWLVVLEATTYTRIHGQQQLGKCLCVTGSQPMGKNSRKILCKIFSLYKNFFTTKIKQITVFPVQCSSFKSLSTDTSFVEIGVCCHK